MDNQELAFTLSFLSEHPRSAVKVLEHGDIRQVAEFITNVPADYLTPVMQQMLPEFAAKLAAALPPDKAATLLADVDVNSVANILRITHADTRANILGELPKKMRKAASLLLDFSPKTVGAWMTPHVFAMPEDASAGDAVEYLRQGDGTRETGNYLYVVDRDGTLVGRVGIIKLMAGSTSVQLSSLADREVPALPGQMLLEQAMEHKAWLATDSLPVLSRQKQFLGVLPHNALRKGLAQLQGQISQAPATDPVSSIFEVYGHSLLALFNTVSEAVETEYKK